MAAGHPSGVTQLSFLTADRLPQSRESVAPRCGAHSHRAVVVFSGMSAHDIAGFHGGIVFSALEMERVFMVDFGLFYGCGLQHRVRLGKYKRDVDSIQREGENLRAIWSPDTKLIAVLVSIELLNEAAIVAMAFTVCLATLFCVLLFLRGSLKQNGYSCMRVQ